MSDGLHPEKRPYYSILEDQLSAANAKIAKLEKSATTLQQLEELLEKSGTVTLSRMWANFGVRVHTKDCVGDAKTLTDAIAAAWERRGE